MRIIALLVWVCVLFLQITACSDTTTVENSTSINDSVNTAPGTASQDSLETSQNNTGAEGYFGTDPDASAAESSKNTLEGGEGYSGLPPKNPN